MAITLKDYSQALANVIIRQLKQKFIAYILGILPASIAGPLSPLFVFLFGWIFDWMEKQTEFLLFCKYTDFRVAHQGNELSIQILKEIVAKKGENIDEIRKAEEEADRAFDKFVTLSK